jgi:hypothetical protein
MILKYNRRPKYYVFDKNDPHMREQYPRGKKTRVVATVDAQEKWEQKSLINTLEFASWDHLVNIDTVNITFTSKKGGLNVAFEKVRK